MQGLGWRQNTDCGHGSATGLFDMVGYQERAHSMFSCEPGATLLCMGLFSRFFVQALPCTAEGAQCRVRDRRSLVLRAYGTNRSHSNTSCSNRPPPSCAAASARSAPDWPRSWTPLDALLLP